MEPSSAPGELGAMLRAASDFASYPGLHSDDAVRQFLEQCPLPMLLSALQSETDVPGMVETVTQCLHKVFSSRYGASLLPNYGAFIQAGLLTDSKDIRKLACKAVLHLLDKAEDDAAAVETVVQHNLYPLLINCLIAGDEEISAVILYAVKRLAQIPKGAEIIFPPGGLGSMQLGKVAALSSSLAWIRILSLIAKLFTVSSYTATSIRDSNLLSIFEDEIKDRRDMLKTLSALEVLYELVEHPHSNIFLLKTNLLQLIIDVINDSSADSVIRSRAALISGRLLSSADAFTAVDQSYVTNLLVAIDKILKMEESMNTDEIESALETLGLIGTTTQGAHFLLTSSNVVRHVVKSSFDCQGRGRQLAALHAFGSICGADRQEDQVKLDGQAEDCLKLLVYTTAANSPKFTPSALLLSILQQDPDIRIAGYRVISVLVVREWCLREVFLYSEIIKLITDPTMETTKIGLEARYDCCVAINKALSSSHLLHEASLPELVGKIGEVVDGPVHSAQGQVHDGVRYDFDGEPIRKLPYNHPAANFQSLSLHNEEFGSGAFSGLLPQKTTDSIVELPVLEESAPVDQIDARNQDCYEIGAVNLSADENLEAMIKAAPSVSQANVLRPDVLDPPGLLYDLTSASHAYSNTNASQPSTNFVEQKLYTDDELELFLIEWINNPSCNTPIREMPVYLYDLDQLRSGGNEQYFLMVLQTFRENKIKRKFENHSWSYSTLAYGKFTEQVTYQYKKDGKLIKDVRIIEFTKRGGPKDKALVKIVFNDRRKGDLHWKQKDVLPKQVLQMQKSQLQGPAKESQDKCESCSKLKEMYDSLLQQKEQELDDVKKKWQEAQAQVAKLGLSVNDIQEIIRAGVQALKQVGASLHPRQHDEEHDDAGGLTYRQDGGENGPGLRSAVGCGICCQDS